MNDINYDHDHDHIELCESCEKNEANELHLCPRKEAIFCGGSPLAEELCNCCDECYAECHEAS